MENCFQNYFKKNLLFLPAFLITSYVVLFSLLHSFGEVFFTYFVFSFLIILTFKVLGFSFFRIHYLVPIVLALLFIFFSKLFKSKKEKIFDPKFLIFIFSLMNFFVIVKIMNLHLQMSNLIKKQSGQEELIATKKCNKVIYFIILDTYISGKALLEKFNFDNSTFLKELKRIGFFIGQDSFSNYPWVANPFKPIMIIQGDHGVNQGLYGIKKEEVAQKEKSFGKQNYDILNAMYLPEINKKLLYSKISPVNNFRLIFQNYFGVNIELIKDKSFVPSEENFGEFIQI